MFLWYNREHRRRWTQQPQIKYWTRLFAFHITLMPLGMVCIQLFSIQNK